VILFESYLMAMGQIDYLGLLIHHYNHLESVDTTGVHVLVDEALTIADEADEENPVSIQKAKLRTQVRQWTAERWNKRDYGAAKAEVAISITGLHFDALRARTVDMGQIETVEAIAPPSQEELDAL
jgi:hypothetical protein